MIEKYFELRVVCPPYKPNSIWGWGRAWGAPPAVFHDFVHIMRCELAGPGIPAHPNGNVPWNLQWALRSPPQAPPIVPAGNPAVLLIRNKILIFVSFFFIFNFRKGINLHAQFLFIDLCKQRRNANGVTISV